MKPTNGYISSERAIELIKNGGTFRQDLMQTKFFVNYKCETFKLNKKSATIVKQFINNK